MYLQKISLNPCSTVPLALEQNINQVVVNAQGVDVVDPVQCSPNQGTKHFTVRYSLFFLMEPLVYFVV